MSLRSLLSKIVATGGAALLALGAFAASPVQASDGTGRITAIVHQIPTNVMDQYNTYNRRAYSPNNVQMQLLSGVPVELIDEQGTVLATAVTSYRDSYTQNGAVVFDNVPYGTYRLRLNLTELTHLTIFPQTVNSALNGEQHSLTSTPITLSPTQDEFSEDDGLRWALIYKNVGVTLQTKVGQFPTPDGPSENFVLFPDGGGMTSEEYNGSRMTAINGVLYTSNLSNMGISLIRPQLSEAEKQYGYEFLGWTLGEETMFPDTVTVNNVLSDADAANLQAYPAHAGGFGDFHFKAVWKYPVHTVTFATDSEKGVVAVQGQDVPSVGFEIKGSSSSLASLSTELPSIKAKEGYEFLGWFEDHTTNLVPQDKVLGAQIVQDKTYYAKYRAIQPEPKKHAVVFKAMNDGSLVGRDSIVVTDGKYLPETPVVKAHPGKAFAGWRGQDGSIYPDAFTLVAQNMVRSDLVFEAVYTDAPSEQPAPAATDCNCVLKTVISVDADSITVNSSSGAKVELLRKGITTNVAGKAKISTLAATGAQVSARVVVALAFTLFGGVLVTLRRRIR